MTQPDLPDRYPKGNYHHTPKDDIAYIEAVHKALRGGVFLDPGTIRNAENARQRLIRFGMIEDSTKGAATDEDN